MSTMEWTEDARWQPAHLRAALKDAEGLTWASFSVSTDSYADLGWRVEAEYDLPCSLSGHWSNDQIADAEAGKALAAVWAAQLEALAAVLQRHEEERANGG